MLNLFLGNIRDARVSLEIFLGGPEFARKAGKKDKCEKTWILQYFEEGPKGPKLFGGCLGCIKVPRKKKKNENQK